MNVCNYLGLGNLCGSYPVATGTCVLIGTAIVGFGIAKVAGFALPKIAHLSEPSPNIRNLSQYAAPLVLQPPLPEMGSLTTQDIPLDVPLILTREKTGSLKICRSGLSENAAFKDSHFQTRKIDDQYNYEIIRKPWNNPTQTLTSSSQGREVQFASWPSFEEFMRTKDVPVSVLENLPDDAFIGSGAIGQVYDLAPTTGEQSVIKLIKSFSNTRESMLFVLKKPGLKQGAYLINYISPLTSETMFFSFDASLSKARALCKLPDHKTILQCKGIMWVKDLNQWGVVFEKIENARKFRDHIKDIRKKEAALPNILKLMHNLAIGLQILDQNGCTQDDLKEENVLIREDSSPVIIDLSEALDLAEFSIESRQQFGTLLYRSLVSNDSTFKGAPDMYDKEKFGISRQQIIKASGASAEIADLIFACWSNQSMEACSWDHILEVLKKSL